MDVERLLFGVVLDGVAPEFSTNSRLTVAAERKLRCSVHESIDPNRAGADIAADANCGVDVPAPDAGGEAVVGGVRKLDRLRQGVECSATTTGPKTSAREMSIDVVTSSTMVGAMKKPFNSSLAPPARILAPFCSAARTWPSILPR